MIQVIRVLRSCYVYDIKTSNMLSKFRDCIFVGEGEGEKGKEKEKACLQI